MATSINRMGTVGILLAVAMCCGVPEASAQLFLNIGGPGSGNASARGSAGIGTANLGIGGPGSATEVQGLNEPIIGSNRGIKQCRGRRGSSAALIQRTMDSGTSAISSRDSSILPRVRSITLATSALFITRRRSKQD